jgi:hypothetical protein
MELCERGEIVPDPLTLGKIGRILGLTNPFAEVAQW